MCVNKNKPLFNKKAVKKYVKSKGYKIKKNALLSDSALNGFIIEILNRVIRRAKENAVNNKMVGETDG